MSDSDNTQDSAAMSPASTGSVKPAAWAVCNPVGTYYRSFGYHCEALECCLQKTRETGDCFCVRALYAALPQPAITDEERRAIGWAAEMMEVGSLPNSLNRDDARVLRGLLERTE